MSTEMTFNVNPDEACEIRERASQILVDPHARFESFLEEIRAITPPSLPHCLRSVLRKFKESGNADGVLLLTGLPVDETLPPTPNCPHVKSNGTFTRGTLADYIITAVASELGEPVGYMQEKGGSIIQDLFPLKVAEAKQVSGSSAVDLEFHTELAFHPFLPSHVLLLGLRADPEGRAKTFFSGIRRIYSKLSSAERKILFSEQFRTGIDYSFDSTYSLRGNGPLLSVLYGDPGDPYLRYDLDLMVGETTEAQKALLRLTDLILAERRFVVIQPGSLVILDNRRAVHGRSQFQARYDGNDRWLLRMSVVEDLEPSRSDRPISSRVIATDFSKRLPKKKEISTTATDSKSLLIELRQARIKKLDEIRALGLAPYASGSSRTHFSASVKSGYPENQDHEVCVAGRVMLLRPHGGVTFITINDEKGSIQLVLHRESISGAKERSIDYNHLYLLDIGDFIEARGKVTRTRRGEISVDVRAIRVLTKSLRPLPDKRFGLQDTEAIQRRRYLDTTMQPSRRERFYGISKMLLAIREFLDQNGYSEFITPVLQPQYGGGSAEPFITYLNALGCRMYLSISHELYLKRLIAGGFEKVYTIGRYFRNEGIDRTHQPEFSMLETMAAYQNYEDNMALLEELFRYVAHRAFGRYEFRVNDHVIDFQKPWRRITMNDVVREVTGVDFLSFSTPVEANSGLRSLEIDVTAYSTGEALGEAFERLVKPQLISPTIVYGHPVEVSPLAKPMEDDSRCAERFELFIAGMEVSENWTEQTDPLALLGRWEEMRSSSIYPEDVQPIDYSFIEVLEHGMPPTSGVGPGIERMAMLFTETNNIDDVLFFPLARPKASRENIAIFGERAIDSEKIPGNAPRINNFAVSAEEFEALLAGVEGVEGDVVVSPYVRFWPSAPGNGSLTASGFVEIDGLMPVARLTVTGCHVFSQQAEARSEIYRQMQDLIEHGIADNIRRAFPSTSVVVKEVGRKMD